MCREILENRLKALHKLSEVTTVDRCWVHDAADEVTKANRSTRYCCIKRDYLYSTLVPVVSVQRRSKPVGEKTKKFYSRISYVTIRAYILYI